MKKIYLAGGCFWGVEQYFKQIQGVINTKVGYANGKTNNPTYKTIKESNHVETVYIEYDEEIVGLGFILEMFYKVIDPTSINKQGEDEGTQYRSGIYYVDNNDLSIINNSINNLEKEINAKTAIEIESLDGFYDAEEYHQDYLEKNPTGYCHISKESFDKAKNTKVSK
ncbi:MAG: peptide-methionine (S)-S-oxide reductase MsrA [bacterium]